MEERKSPANHISRISKQTPSACRGGAKCERERGRKRTHVHGREDELIARYARCDGPVLGRQIDVLGQDAVPFCRRGAEDDAAVATHAECAHGVVLVQPALLDELLRHAVARAEEDLAAVVSPATIYMHVELASWY